MNATETNVIIAFLTTKHICHKTFVDKKTVIIQLIHTK